MNGSDVTGPTLTEAVAEVLEAVWRCTRSAVLAQESLPHASTLPVSLDGTPCELHLAAAPGAVAALLPRMLGRAAAADEVANLAAELVAELLNQVAGHWAGRLGARGVEVTLGTPVAATFSWRAPVGAEGSTTAMPASVVLPMTCAGHPLALSLSCPAGTTP
ncbi:MAG: hypothetical protein RJB26_569 [Pseudomonadota bacterium]